MHINIKTNIKKANSKLIVSTNINNINIITKKI